MTASAREPQPIAHGTWMAYNKHKCRCDACRALNAEYSRQYRAANRDQSPQRRKGRLAADDPRHGTETAYTHWGCRCDRCRESYATIRKARRDEF